MKQKLMTVAIYLTDQSESKKHGGYEIYEDDKIRIAYDTYYPNVQVNVKIDGKNQLAAIFSGHGHTQEYHGGVWEKYVIGTLYPLALIKKEECLAKQQKRKLDDERKKNARLNDASVFE